MGIFDWFTGERPKLEVLEELRSRWEANADRAVQGARYSRAAAEAQGWFAEACGGDDPAISAAKWMARNCSSLSG